MTISLGSQGCGVQESSNIGLLDPFEQVKSKQLAALEIPSWRSRGGIVGWYVAICGEGDFICNISRLFRI